ncbi:hypothetical protein I317_02940 [Kwoniella heveanensis CBS 569]|nr:hypothetical protein I317_02940 [Kwoniella heveanensis CBS 569]
MALGKPWRSSVDDWKGRRSGSESAAESQRSEGQERDGRSGGEGEQRGKRRLKLEQRRMSSGQPVSPDRISGEDPEWIRRGQVSND